VAHRPTRGGDAILTGMHTERSCAALLVGGGVTGVIDVARSLERNGYHVEFWGSATDAMQAATRRAGYHFRILDGLWCMHGGASPCRGDGPPQAAFHEPPGVLSMLRARRTFRRRLAYDLYRCELSIDRVLHHVRPALVLVDATLLAYYPLFWARGATVVTLSGTPGSRRDVPRSDPIPVEARASAFGDLNRHLRRAGRRVSQIAAGIIAAYSSRELLRACALRTAFPLRRELVRRGHSCGLHFRGVQEWEPGDVDVRLRSAAVERSSDARLIRSLSNRTDIA
jgi:hypothetical protein